MRLLRTMILALAVLMTGTAVAQKGTKNFASMKVAKKGSVEYEAQRQAALLTLDSIITIMGDIERKKKTFGDNTKLTTDNLFQFLDDVCAKFDNDPVFLDKVAESTFLHYTDFDGERRYSKLKQLYPNYGEAYINEGRLLHALAYRPNEKGIIVRDTAMLAKARVQFDSAKVVMPKNPEPYMVWMRLQAKYDDADADAEIEKLKKAIPGYPADLEAALYYDYIAKGDYNSLLRNALAHFEKVNLSTMTAKNLAVYSLLCYRGLGSAISERGLDLAKTGLKKDPNEISLYRCGLWNAGKAEKWDDAIEMGLLFFEKGDTVSKSALDYRWLAEARKAKKNYVEAVQLYKKELTMDSISVKDKAAALSDLVDCYYELTNLYEAKNVFHQYEAFKEKNNLKMDYVDYNQLMKVFVKEYQDTLLSQDARRRALISADSLALLAAENDTRYRGRFYETHYSYIYALYPPENDIPTQEMLDCVKLMESRMKELVEDPEYKAFVPRNTYYLLEAKYNIMTWYYYKEKYLEAKKLAEELMYDMPEVSELLILEDIDSDFGILSQSQQGKYAEYKAGAKKVYDNSVKKR